MLRRERVSRGSVLLLEKTRNNSVSSLRNHFTYVVHVRITYSENLESQNAKQRSGNFWPTLLEDSLNANDAQYSLCAYGNYVSFDLGTLELPQRLMVHHRVRLLCVYSRVRCITSDSPVMPRLRRRPFGKCFLLSTVSSLWCSLGFLHRWCSFDVVGCCCLRICCGFYSMWHLHLLLLPRKGGLKIIFKHEPA